MRDLPRRIESEIPALRRYARVLVRDPDRADDLVQDCLERALSRLRFWRREGNLRAWLFTILHNIHANQVRARSRRPRTLPLDDEAGGARTTSDDPQTRIALEQALDALWALPAEQREVLLLVVVEGLPYREVSAVLRIPIGTVMSRLARARERLRAVMEDSQPLHLRRVK
jgi:RNA polymerase sigma-70 factor (ECF subfamily)